MSMRVLVCGGRGYADREEVFAALDYYDPCVVIAGGAKGADTLARDWAVLRERVHHIYPAQWKRYGRSAGPIRNCFMLEDSKPSLVLAFPGGNGTAHMIAIAEEAGIEVVRA